MDRRFITDRATDCEVGSTDWTTIGARILDAALIASAMHAGECARVGGRNATLAPLDGEASGMNARVTG